MDFAGNTIDDDRFSVSTLIEKANRNVGAFAPQGLAIVLHKGRGGYDIRLNNAFFFLQERTSMNH